MRVSVVINTYNRSAALRQTLLSLRQQRYRQFEVIVVNGPSTDDTETVLESFAPHIKIARCPEAQLARSRNLGILAADGEIVAFIDDDAVPEPNWLIELTAGFDSPRIGAVGGIVYDHTGTKLQNRYACCFRHGEPKFDIEPPWDDYVRPGADPFLYLQGTNMSYTRRVLELIAGFDENILHYFDDVETCLQVIDHGHVVRPLPNAAVHHKYLPSHIRNHSRLMLDPYRFICDNTYFAFKYGRSSRSAADIERILRHKITDMKSEAAGYLNAGRMTHDQHNYYVRRLEEAIVAGTDRGLRLARAGRTIPPANPACFLPFSPTPAPDRRLTMVWIDSHYCSNGSPRWLEDSGRTGHEVHVITPSDDNTYRLDMKEGIWIHHVPSPLRWCPELEGHPAENLLKMSSACYHEIGKVQAGGHIDLIATPLGETPAALCNLDDRFPTVQIPAAQDSWSILETQFRTIIETHRSTRGKSAQVHAKWTEVLKSSFKFSTRMARRIVARLLDSSRYPVDYPAQIREFWKLSEADCLQEMYVLLLGRKPKSNESEHWLRVARSRSMIDVVRQLASSEEARKRRIPTDWLRELIPALGHREPGKSRPTSSARRIRNHFYRLPMVGKFLRAAKRLFSRSK